MATEVPTTQESEEESKRAVDNARDELRQSRSRLRELENMRDMLEEGEDLVDVTFTPRSESKSRGYYSSTVRSAALFDGGGVDLLEAQIETARTDVLQRTDDLRNAMTKHGEAIRDHSKFLVEGEPEPSSKSRRRK